MKRDIKTLSMFPRISEWLPPQSFPNLSEAKEIAIDLETCDPNMESLGPGWPRNDGYIVGYAIAVDGWTGYYPVAHGGGGNLGRQQQAKRRIEQARRQWHTSNIVDEGEDQILTDVAHHCL